MASSTKEIKTGLHIKQHAFSVSAPLFFPLKPVLLITVFFYISLLLTPSISHAQVMGAKDFVDINAGVGIPRLISFRVSATRLFPVTFGFGLGTIPIESAARKYLDINPNDYAQEVQGITILPDFSLSWGAFETFLRWYPFSSGFYLETLYEVWNIKGSVTASATGGQLGSSNLNLGSVTLNVIQPMYGAGCGWRWFMFSPSFYFDLGVGAVYFVKPKYSVGTYTIADPYEPILSQFLPAETMAQVEDGKQKIRDGVDDAMSKYRAIVKYGPIISLSFGVTL